MTVKNLSVFEGKDSSVCLFAKRFVCVHRVRICLQELVDDGLSPDDRVRQIKETLGTDQLSARYRCFPLENLCSGSCHDVFAGSPFPVDKHFNRLAEPII